MPVCPGPVQHIYNLQVLMSASAGGGPPPNPCTQSSSSRPPLPRRRRRPLVSLTPPNLAATSPTTHPSGQCSTTSWPPSFISNVLVQYPCHVQTASSTCGAQPRESTVAGGDPLADGRVVRVGGMCTWLGINAVIGICVQRPFCSISLPRLRWVVGCFVICASATCETDSTRATANAGAAVTAMVRTRASKIRRAKVPARFTNAVIQPSRRRCRSRAAFALARSVRARAANLPFAASVATVRISASPARVSSSQRSRSGLYSAGHPAIRRTSS